MKIAIIGAGLFGSIIAKTLRRDGHEVVVMADDRPGVGSAAAACLMKPSWLNSMAKQDQRDSLELLDDLYGVHKIHFFTGRIHSTVGWVDPYRILRDSGDIVRVKVEGVAQNVKGWTVFTAKQNTFDFDHVIVAAGAWCNEILPAYAQVPGLEGMAGVSFLFHGQLKFPFIKPWAPYKQIVAFNISDKHVWIGDGSSIKQGNWKPERTAQCYERCVNALHGQLPNPQVYMQLFGLRPYVKNSSLGPCYLAQPKPGLHVVTGGAKNGTISAAWAALQLSKELRS